VGNSSQELAELVAEQTTAKAQLKGLWQFYKEEVLADVTDETGAGGMIICPPQPSFWDA